MRLRSLIHTALHVGCVALLLVQGYRIQQLRQLVADDQQRADSARKAYAQQIEQTRFFVGELQADRDDCWRAIALKGK